MKFLIVGRAASGKGTLRQFLEQDYAWSFAKSFTTRERRRYDENTYTFVCRETAAYDKDKVAVTYFGNGHGGVDEYYSTADQIKSSDAYIVDPLGFRQVVTIMAQETWALVYMYPPSTAKQVFKYLVRSNFDFVGTYFRITSEDARFSEFESLLKGEVVSVRDVYSNVKCVVPYVNRYKSNSVRVLARVLNDIRSCCS